MVPYSHSTGNGIILESYNCRLILAKEEWKERGSEIDCENKKIEDKYTKLFVAHGEEKYRTKFILIFILKCLMIVEGVSSTNKSIKTNNLKLQVHHE